MVPGVKVKSKSDQTGNNLNVLISKVTIDSLKQEEEFDTLEFKRSVVYRTIEQAAIIGDGLEFKTEGDRKLIELDSHSCTQVCQSYLACLERLCTNAFELETDPKLYRRGFS